jgi:hypothetical protein
LQLVKPVPRPWLLAPPLPRASCTTRCTPPNPASHRRYTPDLEL